MDLTPYVDALRQDLLVAAEPGGPDAHALADRLTAPLESATRLVLLDALSAAAGEITRDLAPGSVDLRLRGREPSFVVTLPPAEQGYDEDDAPATIAGPPAPLSGRAVEDDDSAMTRINLRLPQDLKDRVEDSARVAGLSVNAWLVRAATAGLAGGERDAVSWVSRAARGGDRLTGWVR